MGGREGHGVFCMSEQHARNCHKISILTEVAVAAMAGERTGTRGSDISPAEVTTVSCCDFTC